ncbi:MAG: BON domain-containing protein [Woeseia sp.]|nr:BON domain-containing protein [Woeseia sp.]NNE60409.1 BON domain-containing protein [Woeseia sp.]NNL55757.1 BON domain-containing protein [Woeseia sp.]
MRLLILLVGVLALPGCAALMVGGAAAGGYQLGKDERSAGQVTRDGATTTKIKSKMIADKVVNAFSINVDTYADRVTLRGSVGSYAARKRAGQIAAGTDGVIDVDNQIKVVLD